MIGWYRNMVARRIERQQEAERAQAMAILEDPTLFTQKQRDALKELFPTPWTHMDNFSQEEIFKIAVTMSVFGYSCDNPVKMKAAMDLLALQDIYRVDPGNPNLIKRA